MKVNSKTNATSNYNFVLTLLTIGELQLSFSRKCHCTSSSNHWTKLIYRHTYKWNKRYDVSLTINPTLCLPGLTNHMNVIHHQWQNQIDKFNQSCGNRCVKVLQENKLTLSAQCFTGYMTIKYELLALNLPA